MPGPNDVRSSDARRTAPADAKRKVPPLVWIIVALVLAWLVVISTMRGGRHELPHGGSYPQPKPDTSYMPAAPARDGAPGTPGGPVTH